MAGRPFGLFRGPLSVARLVGIGLTLARHDALFPLEWVGAPPRLLALARPFARHRGGRPGQRLAAALQALGPTFIKLGQALSTRADLVGDDIAADLSDLRDRLPPFPTAAARAIVARELGHPVETLFAAFADTPVAAASIAQVHFAETPEGVPVAVKILRPGIEAAFARDLALFRWLAGLVARTMPWSRRFKPEAVVETFAETVRIEMDLRFEAAAASELAENFAGDPAFRVPAVDWTRTGRRVLTIARISGTSIADRDRLLALGHDLDRLLTVSAEAFFNQVFRDGFFHGDMHPGNFFVADDGTLVAVDFGIMGRLDRRTREYLADMLLGFLQGDYRRVAEVHFDAGYVPADQSIDRFTQACRSIGEPILGRPLARISLARLLGQLFQVAEEFHMEVQPQLLLLQKTMLLAEGVGRQLNPDVNMWLVARPLIEAWMIEHRGPEARLRARVDEATDLLRRAPRVLDDIARAARTASEGLRLHPDTLRALAGSRERAWPGLVALAALAVAAVALFR